MTQRLPWAGARPNPAPPSLPTARKSGLRCSARSLQAAPAKFPGHILAGPFPSVEGSRVAVGLTLLRGQSPAPR